MSQTAYRTSFALDLLGQLGLALLELSEIYVVFHNVDALGGLDFGPALLVFALANVSWSVADTIVGHLDTLPSYIRTGTLDAMLLRPLPALGAAGHQRPVAAPARPGRRWAWSCSWSPCRSPSTTGRRPRCVLLVITPLTGAAIFAALFVGAAGAQFWLVDGAEMTNAFTYGSSYVSSYPTSVLHSVARVFFTFVVPAAFVSYLPTLVLTDQAGPPGLPGVAGLAHAGDGRRWPGARRCCGGASDFGTTRERADERGRAERCGTCGVSSCCARPPDGCAAPSGW